MSTSTNAIRQANALGQSIWLDSISRSMIASGELARYVEAGVSGVTSNPTIFEKAISDGASYDDALVTFARAGGDAQRIFEKLAIEDIRDAADVLRKVYDSANGKDGFVSIEVSPRLARNTAGTVEEARRLFESIGRPNVMIKVPGTAEGMPAVRALIAEGINVNVTLLFSIAAYKQSAQAYMAGLRDFHASGHSSLSHVASVASFFVSRVDTAVDKELESPPRGVAGIDPNSLRNAIGIANARIAYAEFQGMFNGPIFSDMRRAGAQVQRPLWASTSTKNPKLSDTLYVDNLIGADTVNTVPPATLTAFMEHGNVAPNITRDVDVARAQMKQLSELGISLDGITGTLLAAGVQSFSDSYDKLLKQIEAKLAKIAAAAPTGHAGSAKLGQYRAAVDAEVARLAKANIVDRIWRKDESLWPKPAAGGAVAKDRLGWLSLPETMHERGAEAAAFVGDIRMPGVAVQFALMGMGGSSMAAEAMRAAKDLQNSWRDLTVLDSIVWEKQPGNGRFDPRAVMFIVSSKSGTTAEVVELETRFRDELKQVTPRVDVASRFMAITDAGTPLARRSAEFRRVFIAPSDIGGRYSALSEFGLVPAAVMKLDMDRMTASARSMASACKEPDADNPGLLLGTTLAMLAKQGRDKVTFVTSRGLGKFAVWIEQLLAESTGKDGKGLIPVAGEAFAPGSEIRMDHYSSDRAFVFILGAMDANEATWYAGTATKLESAGHPVITYNVPSVDALAGEFFRWEFATAVAGHILGVNPFDEPEVGSAKQKTNETLERGWARAVPERTLYAAIEYLLKQQRKGDYFSIAAFAPESVSLDQAMASLREGISGRTGMATTFGYGPRYLHSIGQLHKGGPDSALILVLRRAGTGSRLLNAQAAGDVEALREKSRRVAFVEFDNNAYTEISTLVNSWRV